MTGHPCHRRWYAVGRSAHPWFARCDGEQPPFEQARCVAMRFEVRCVDHKALGLGPFPGECREDPFEDAEAAPADEAVVERLVRPIILRRIVPLQAMLDNVDDAADDTAITDGGNTVCQRKEG